MKAFSIGTSQEKVIEHLSKLIIYYARIAHNEQCAPIYDPAKSEEYIKINIIKLKELRKLRNEFENITTGVIL